MIIVEVGKIWFLGCKISFLGIIVLGGIFWLESSFLKRLVKIVI